MQAAVSWESIEAAPKEAQGSWAVCTGHVDSDADCTLTGAICITCGRFVMAQMTMQAHAWQRDAGRGFCGCVQGGLEQGRGLQGARLLQARMAPASLLLPWSPAPHAFLQCLGGNWQMKHCRCWKSKSKQLSQARASCMEQSDPCYDFEARSFYP